MQLLHFRYESHVVVFLHFISKSKDFSAFFF